MSAIEIYGSPDALPGSEAGRVGMLLGLEAPQRIDDVGLTDLVSWGLRAEAAEALARFLGRDNVVGPVIPEATFRRAKTHRKVLSREMSGRLYRLGLVVDAVSRAYRGDSAAIARFLKKPHMLLGGRTPPEMTQSGSAEAEAVINMLRRANAGFAL